MYLHINFHNVNIYLNDFHTFTKDIKAAFDKKIYEVRLFTELIQYGYGTEIDAVIKLIYDIGRFWYWQVSTRIFTHFSPK